MIEFILTLVFEGKPMKKAGLEKCTTQPTPMAYLAITRPDIQFVVNRVAQRMHQPSEHDYHCLKRILKYIFGTLGHGLLIRPGDLELRGFSDSDWANDKNYKKSTSGEAEYRAFALLAAETIRRDTLNYYLEAFESVHFYHHNLFYVLHFGNSND
uniref:Reverse transcriptase Ty1/copia-type domain-containing protein n=1 Tax=Solanum lycopersicum TaxID=4081 RepID=A0A3Q7GLB1_SOLLC